MKKVKITKMIKKIDDVNSRDDLKNELRDAYEI